MSGMLVVGLLLAAMLSGIAYRVWGEQAAIATASFGGLAIAIQLGALALLQAAKGASFQRFLTRWGAGMGLRMLGVVAIALAAGFDPKHFPPLAAAAGFLGVLLPLLLLEVRLVR
ncbi:MAG TPA: hypothetical protein VGP61_08320 [Gemmatimonadales bacterium]|nr:hypothetical protein [Gemmatimonadales bacterium]